MSTPRSCAFHSITAASLLLTSLTAQAASPNLVNLGTAADYAVLAKTAITTTGTTSIVGDLGISPAAESDMTGFGQTLDPSGQFSTSSLVTGKIYAADYGGATETRLTTAVLDMQAAYTDAAGRSNPDFLNFLGGSLNGQTLEAGLYKWTSGVTITDSVTIDGGGDPNAVWIFQIDNRLELASGAEIFLINSAMANNIFWQTAEGATLGTDSHFEGTILTLTDVSVLNGASMNARLLAQTATTLDSNAVQILVPEPSTYAMIMGLSVIGLLCVRRQSRLVNA